MSTNERRLVGLIRDAVRVGLAGGLDAAHTALRNIRLLSDVLALDSPATPTTALHLARLARMEDLRDF